ncbi:MAG: DinB family protein [Acidobacteria bacterium]|nr:MAG: DinB family protein [Acidobacteriota bacterium]REK04018.1 MAG: DinB family protein [Acidobacteriota bacterium]REK15180.1 MAG: DinB family protein [Acidobacteriota bacterium]REK46270.1 MAG: DinB family protein [Acidobacteriota bacterium]
MHLFILDPYDTYKAIAAVVAFLAIFFSCAAGSAAYGQNGGEKTDPTVLTDTERAKAIQYLEQTKKKLTAELSGLTDRQLYYKASDDRWSVAEVAEHIIVAEQRISELISETIAKSPENASPDVHRFNDTAIPLAITNRNQKFTAPPVVQPNGRWKSRDELLSEWDTSREKTIDFLRTTQTNLRTRFAENPVLGTIDAFQWIIFLDSHSRRHLAQIAEIKAEAGYPSK